MFYIFIIRSELSKKIAQTQLDLFCHHMDNDLYMDNHISVIFFELFFGKYTTIQNSVDF